VESIRRHRPALGRVPQHEAAQLGFFDYCVSQGLAAEYRVVRADELATVDALWMTNSQRLAAPATRLDGRPLEVDRAFTAAVNDYLLHRRA
jgi:4-amino-4-deoxychorismate lyase